jgi:hypothetical protein
MEEKIIFQDIEFFPIPNYDKYYASRCGQIYSGKSNKIMKTAIKKNGYETIGLSMGTSRSYCYTTVHFLVAKTFLGERPKGYDINHIDFNKLNNHVSNLEYLTRHENVLHSYQNKKFVKVYEYDINGNFLAEYSSIAELGNLKGFDRSTISKILMGKSRYIKGFYYTREKLNFAKPRISLQDKPVVMFDLKGLFLKRFDSIKKASIYSGADSSSIIRCCKGKVKSAAKHKFQYE